MKNHDSTIDFLTLWGLESKRAPQKPFCFKDFFVTKFVKRALALLNTFYMLIILLLCIFLIRINKNFKH